MIKNTLNVVCVISALIFNCTNSKTNKTTSTKEPYILKIANTPVTTREFQYVYNKNNANQSDSYSNKSIREYLDLYVKFRLKVREAESMGLDTTKEFNAELAGYKKQLATPYMTEKSVTERLVKEAYQRLNEEVKASHILIKVNENAEPKDTLIAYNKILEIRKNALSGEGFDALAKKYSDDPSAQTNFGNLGYFTSMQMVYPFEDGAYKTKMGEISMPVRTKFGYHLIKVYDRRAAKGEIKVAHIMVRYSMGSSTEDSIASLKKINEIYSKLQKGEKWEILCTEFSDDMNSRNKGGELPPFTTGNMIPSFEDASFKLNSANDIAAPIQTQYGFHIIKLIEKKNIQSFETMESTIKAKVAKDSRSDLSKTFLLNRLRRENKFTENQAAQSYIYSLADSNLTKGKFIYNAAKKENSQTLFSIGTKKYLVNDFLMYLKSKQKNKSTGSPNHTMNLLYKDYVNESLLINEEANLESKYVDYKMLTKEYRDGILLFQLMDAKVWTKAIEDTAGLKNYFAENKDQYKWTRRCDAVVYNCADIATLIRVKTKLNDKFFDVNYEKGGTIIYAKSKTDMAVSDKKTVDEIKNILSRDVKYHVELTASATATEVKESKKSLSKERLNKIVKYLISIGVDSNKIIKKDLGVMKNIPDQKNNSGKVNFMYLSTSITTLEKSLNAEKTLALQIKEGKFQANEDVIIDSFEWKVGENIFEKNGRNYLVVVKSIIEPTYKTFDEAKGIVVSDYQNYLEKQWVNSLKTKYKVEVNEDEVKKLIKN